MIFEFTIPGKPCGKGRPRFTKNGHTFTPEKTANYETLVKLAFRQAYPNAEPIAAKVEVIAKITAYYPIPVSTSKKLQAQMRAGLMKPTTKPDTDNIAKICLDALNGIAYHDDAQIVGLQVNKLYSDEPRVEVKLEVVSRDN